MAHDVPISEVEYNPYYDSYIQLAVERPLLEALKEGLDHTVAFFESIPANKQSYRYEEGKWTPKEILLHLIDSERVFAMRAHWFARGGGATLPGFDQDVFAKNADANERSMQALIGEYQAVRLATIELFLSFTPNDLNKIGKASGNKLSVLAAGYIIAGHEMYHQQVIKERYL